MTSGGVEKKTLNFREGDWEYLTHIYQPQGLSTSEVIRSITSRLVDSIRKTETPVNLKGVEL